VLVGSMACADNFLTAWSSPTTRRIVVFTAPASR